MYVSSSGLHASMIHVNRFFLCSTALARGKTSHILIFKKKKSLKKLISSHKLWAVNLITSSPDGQIFILISLLSLSAINIWGKSLLWLVEIARSQGRWQGVRVFRHVFPRQTPVARFLTIRNPPSKAPDPPRPTFTAAAVPRALGRHPARMGGAGPSASVHCPVTFWPAFIQSTRGRQEGRKGKEKKVHSSLHPEEFPIPAECI